ncbi:major facilitator superfamily transporter [Nitzschia inconspicua]|uniref:Major facilitator superfamily transporter n=1 Tax=Nitzschia inconspicua TaxID=303405 RepID=A0A9K3M560_9STRA|nr:major facilitator superfamily transporter [Nitzschia inconspicua]
MPTQIYTEIPSREDAEDDNMNGVAAQNDDETNDRARTATSFADPSTPTPSFGQIAQTQQEMPLTGHGPTHVFELFQDEAIISSTTTAVSRSTDISDDAMIMTVDEAIERIGMGYFQLVVLTAAGLCFAADAMQVLLLSFLSEVLRLEWNLTENETALITSVLFIGAIFGTLTLGPLADKKGRKPVFLLAATIISFFGVTNAMVTEYWSLLVSLFMVGWGVGGLTVPFDILAEFLPANSRGKNLLVIEYFWTLGVLFVVGVAFLTLGNGETTGSWRSFVVICAIPCWISILIGHCFVPESPRWLCTQGRCEEALKIIRKAAAFNKLDADTLFPPGTQLEDEEKEESDFCELFSPRWRWTTLKLWGAWGFFSFGYYGTIMAITKIFGGDGKRHLVGGQETYSFDYGAIFVSSSAELVGTTIAILCVDVVGRIPLQVVAYSLAGVSVFSLCLSAANGARRYVLISLGFSSRIFEMIGSCVSWVSTAEILTTEVRTTGHSAANAVARIGSLFSPFLMEGHGSLLTKGLIMLVIHAVTVTCVSQLPETKGSHMGRAHHHDEETEELVSNEQLHDAEPPFQGPCDGDARSIS